MSEAFEHIAGRGNQRLFVFGDHASRFIPPEYDNLGLSGDNLTRHIAWDIGTEFLVRRLCDHFGCAGQLAGVSRLVIDLNRDLAAKGLIPQFSDGTVILGNQELSSHARQERIERFYAPYHKALSNKIAALDGALVLSVHSFTPHPLTGAARGTEIGLLVKHDFETAERFVDSFKERGIKAEINKPYSAYDLNYTMDEHIGPHGLPHLAIEIRQDLLGTSAQCADMAAVLIDRLEALLASADKGADK